MCTVTYIPTATGIYLTSNRDERSGRLSAKFPCRLVAESGGILFPRDSDAGGSWIALKERGDAAVLLNGAFFNHRKRSAYRRSRGHVLLEIAGADDSVLAFNKVELEGIAPFTLILFIGGQLFDCRWDGTDKYIDSVHPQTPHIWCSATLYDEKAIKCRQRRFSEWHSGATRIDQNAILDFHRSLRLRQRESQPDHPSKETFTTVSITSIHIESAQAMMRYWDLQTRQQMKKTGFGISDAPAPVHPLGKSQRNHIGNAREWMRRFSIRLMAWEYWPFIIVYLPIFFYWIWLSCKAKSLFFFSTANPTITNAGFAMESKKEIYSLMPEGTYPKTLLCSPAQSVVALSQSIKEHGLVLPLIAKPDIGKRGMQVQLLRNEGELYVYAARSKVNFLLQEYIGHSNEVGIFYYRLPGESKGHISGIVGKELLTVRGDGRSTVEALLQTNDRHVLQLPALRTTSSQILEEIPAAGEERVVAPYGNHSRGALFLDWSDKNTSMLENTIDALCRQIPGFYFGRLDIRFASWEDLCKGRNFSIIELNGAGSEPTHMYDPRHSIFFAWREMIRHLKLLFDISRANAQRENITPMTFLEGWRMLREDARHEKLLS